AALARFDRVVQTHPQYASALVGRGEALTLLGRDADAATAFDAALAADPSLTEVRRRADVLRFRAVERDLASARQAGRSGRTEEALRAYQHALTMSPDSPLLYREIASIEQQSGNPSAALEHFRKAVAL